MSEAVNKVSMPERGVSKVFQYGTTAKALHWLIVALVAVQYLIGWFMPDIKSRMAPGAAMTWHVSIGTTVLALMLFRLAWRLSHRVPPDPSLSTYQRIISEAVHWLIYVLVLLTTVSGWLFASARGWTINWFFGPPLPMLAGQNSTLLHRIDGWHQIFEVSLLILVGLHILAGLVHMFYYRDGIMRRMVPEGLAHWVTPLGRVA